MAEQGAGNNRGQAAGNGRFVKFSRDAAQRIAKAVRTVEGGDRNQPGITFDHPQPSKPGVTFVLAKYTGSAAWVKMQTRQCLLFPTNTNTNSTAALYLGAYNGQTVTAVSLMFSLPGFTGATTLANYTTLGRYVMLSKVNGVYQVIAGEGN